MTPTAAAIAAAARGADGRTVILSANPMHDTGGGQRSAQIARELLRRNRAVVFVSHGQVTETVDLGLRFDGSRLVQLDLSEVTEEGVRDALVSFLSGDDAMVITQLPVEEWRVLLEAIPRAVTVYDCVDPWDSLLGRGWYDREVEAEVARASDVLTATAYDLVDHVERLTGREAHLVPNAFDRTVFDAAKVPDQRPADLPEAERIALYVGSLWYRMDWNLVRHMAEAHPGTAFVFIGDRRREGRGLPANCHFLGLKAQGDLPPYLAAAELAFLPWRSDSVTEATSPLKVYEFVAMGLPVVAPDTGPLRHLPGVSTCADREALVRAVGVHGRSRLDDAERDAMRAFASTSSWSARVDRLLELVAEARGARWSAAPAVHLGATISVAIPSYNHAPYLSEAVESVRAQSLPASDLVIVDDGSTDSTRELLSELEDSNTRVVLQENRGAHRALNRAIGLTRGDYVAILNSDDVFEPGRLEHAWGVARRTGAALLCGAVRLISESGDDADPSHEIARWYAEAREIARSTPSLAAALRYHNVAVTTSNFFVHRTLWERLGGFRAHRYVHDFDFLLRAAALVPDRIVYEDSLCDVRYRVHPVNTITEDHDRANREREEMLRAVRSPLTRFKTRVGSAGAARGVRAAVTATRTLAPFGGGTARPSGDPGEALHVGLVVRSLGEGGLEEEVALLAQGLALAGARTSILCTHGGGAVADRLRDVGVALDVSTAGPATWSRWVRDGEVDVVSSHFAAPEAVAAIADTGCPVVETVHNTYAWLSDEAWVGERDKLTRAAASIAVSETVARYHQRRVGRRPTHVVPNAVHPGRVAEVPRLFARRLLEIDQDVPLCVSIGRLTQQKNLEGLLRAFERAHEESPDIQLLLVGPDEGRRLTRSRKAHDALFRSGAVRHVGTVTDPGVVLSAADAFVGNSFYEGWSVAASEALWLGVPVVLSEAGGARELVGENGSRGIVVPNPCGDPLAVDDSVIAHPPEGAREANEEAFAGALLGVVTSLHQWRARSPDIREHARATLHPRIMSEAYMRVLRDVHGKSAVS